MSRLPMRRLNLLTLLFAAMVPASAGLISAAPALASSSQVLADCNANGHLSGHYSNGDLQGALNGMGADTHEYTNCYDVVRRALLANTAAGGHSGGGPGSTGGTGGSGGSGGQSGPGGSSASAGGTNGYGSVAGSTSGIPKGFAARASSNSPGSLVGTGVQPGATGLNAGSSVRSLPAPLIAVLVLLGLAALSGGGLALRRRVLTRRVLTRHSA